jgi:hypothetical protein
MRRITHAYPPKPKRKAPVQAPAKPAVIVKARTPKDIERMGELRAEWRRG